MNVKKQYYGITHAQKRIWYTEKTHVNSPYSNLSISVKFDNEFDSELLKKAINLSIEKNDSLRLRIVEQEEDNQIITKQYLCDYKENDIEYIDFSQYKEAEQAIEFEKWLDNVIYVPFDLFDNQLYYFAVVKFNSKEHGFFFKIHHIISDGWTLGLLTDEIYNNYVDLLEGKEPSRLKNPSYLDYIEEETQYLNSEAFIEDKQFWAEKYDTIPDPLTLQFDKKSSEGFKSKSKCITIPKEMNQRIADFCKENKVSVYKLLLSAVYLYTSRVTGQDDFIIGCANHNRSTPESQKMTGMFVSTIPLRVNFQREITFKDLVQNINKDLNFILKNHQKYPLDVLVKDFRDKGIEDIYNLTNITVVGHGSGKNPGYNRRYHFPNCEINEMLIHYNLDGEDINGKLELLFCYHEDLYTLENIQNLFNSLMNILRDGLKNPEKKLKEIDLLREKEKQKILIAFNKTKTDYPKEKTMIQLFEEIVNKYPDELAVVFKYENITYKRLNEKANQLARILKDKGVKGDSIVGLMVDRSIEMFVGMLAILKAGGAFLPIETSYPKDRIKYILEDSCANVLLTHHNLADNLDYSGMVIDLNNNDLYNGDTLNADNSINSSNLAYVIYTSGSTGKPKGVMIEHKSLINMCFEYIRTFNLTYKDNVSKNASFGFDASILEIVPPLLVGATLFVIPEEIKFSPHDINEYFEINNISIAMFPTQLGEQFINMVDNKSLRYLLVGGEKLSHYKSSNYKLVNCYGPTECTVYTTCFVVDKNYETIPIGKPIANSFAYVLDKDNNLQPIGVPGELCISGDVLARGYLNNPEMTSKKFVDNPFEPGKKMYKTGDLVKWLADGNIEFIGRVDFQVKLRGFRIELSEIEIQMLKFNCIREAAVILREDSAGNNYLCSYFVADDEVNLNDFKAFISSDLPYYMIPSFFIQLDKMPITSNGKIDRNKLPEPIIGGEIEEDYIAPINDTESKLIEIWKKVLNLEKIGTTNNFFSLGGHSLKAVFLQSQIEKAFNITIPLNHIFKYPTIKELAGIMPGLKHISIENIKVLEKQDYYELSSSQKRLFFVEQMPDIGTTYNVPFFLKIEGKLDKEKLSKAIDQLIERHEALRTSFDIVDGQPMQIIHDKVHIKKMYRETSEELLQEIIDSFIRPFKLNKAPLFRVELINVSDKTHYLLCDFHHIITDGVSIITFIDELLQFYEGRKLEPLKFQYKDFAKWHNNLINSENNKIQETYWIKTFEGEIPTLDIPTDYPPPSILDYDGDESTLTMDKKLAKKVKDFTNKSKTTLFILLMATFNVLLAKYTSQEDIIIGTPVAGRQHSGIENIIGMFVNTIPVRCYPKDEMKFLEFLKEVNNNCIGSFENQDYPFDKIIETLKISRDISRHTLFDVSLVLQNLDIKAKKTKDISINLIEFKKNKAKFDILLEVVEKDNTLVFNWSYRTSLFNKKTIDQMAKHFINLLNTVIEDPDLKLKDINILSKEEEYRQLFDLNDTQVDYPKNTCIHEMFEEQVKLFPGNIAVSYENKSYTYKEVNQKANQVARFLREKGVKTDTIVGIMLDRSAEMITGLLGILKAGGCYLPINPDYPDDRTNYILDNSQAPFVLTTPNHFDKLNFPGEIINILDESIYKEDPSNLNNINTPEDLAYIIYTSGSTGKPKGVMIMHKCVIRLMKNDKMLYDFNELDVWTMFHSFCFDFSVWEIYGAILFGGKLIIVPKKETLSPQAFLQLLKKEKVTVLNQTPGAFYNLIEEDLKGEEKDLSLRYVIFGGEALKPLMLKAWHHKYPDTKLINMYGITETTVHVTYKNIGDYEIDNNISNIGAPIPTLTTYIMDRNMKLVPVGVVGEICVGGTGVARGYVKNPELTSKKFIENPYPPHDRIYKSGDLAKLLPGGEMVYCGRMDFQVKIRGFRIELGEIENQLLKNENIKKVTVIARDDKDGNKFLVAYLVMEKDMTIIELRDYINKDLPDYMIPSFFIKMDEFPLTSNGKVDRKALPDPTENIETGETYIAAETDKQKKLVEIWQKVLGIDKIGLNDNFFALGGHSLKAVSLVADLQKFFNITVNDIFEHQTIAELDLNITELEDNIQVKLGMLSEMNPEKIEEEKQAFLNHPDIKNLIESYHSKNETYLKQDFSTVKDYKNILLTGATGYLGIYLLADLLQNKSSKIYCIVRGKTNEEAKIRLTNKFNYYFGENSFEKYTDRVCILKGDLAKENLDLECSTYSELVNNIDCIIHSAAIVSHYGHYQDFYNINVQATINLLILAKTGIKKDFNHISTISVAAGKIKDKKRMIFTEYDCDLGQQADNYYVKTKFEAEKHVIKARKDGINTNIYRIGNITINSKTGILQDNIEENAFYNVVKSFINLGKVPDKGDEVEFSFVDYVSKSILSLFDKPAIQNEIYHIQNSNIVKLSNILISKELNLNIDKVSLKEFINYLCKNFDKNIFRPYIENILLHRGWLSENQEMTDFIILTDKTELILKKAGFEWPELPVKQLYGLIIKSLERRISFIRTVPIFSNLQIEDIEYIARVAKEINYDEETNIMIENEINKNLYIIVDGFIELNKHSKAGWLGTISVLHESEFMGEDIFLSEKTSPVTAHVIFNDAVILEIKEEDITRVIKKSPEFSMALLGAMSERLRKLESIMVNIG